MKYILLLLPLFSFAQFNFTAIDNKLLYSDIISDNVGIEKMLTHCQDNIRHTQAPEIRDNAIYGTTDYISLLTDTSGIVIAAKSAVRFQYRITFLDGKYNIAIRNIEFKAIEVTVMGVTNNHNPTLEEISLRNKDQSIRKNKNNQRLLERLDAAFLKLFTYNDADKW